MSNTHTGTTRAAVACDCEHASHFKPTEDRTPKGNIGHVYGDLSYTSLPYKTAYSTHNLCERCRADCFGGDTFPA